MKNYHKRVDVTLKGRLNGKDFIGHGNAIINPKLGTYNIAYRFDQPIGNLGWLLVGCTGCGTGFLPPLETRGGKNGFSMTEGNYHFKREFIFEGRGKMIVDFTVKKLEDKYEAVGIVEADIIIPRIVGVLPVRSLYHKFSKGNLASITEINYLSDNDENIAGIGKSQYDFEEKCDVPDTQLRISAINVNMPNEYLVHLDWHMTIQDFDSLNEMKKELIDYSKVLTAI